MIGMTTVQNQAPVLDAVRQTDAPARGTGHRRLEPGLIRDTEEQAMLRQTVAGIAERYGAEYYRRRARSHEGIAELWAELGEAGLVGMHLPERYGGGDAGMTEAVIVAEELAAHGMPLLSYVISPAICGSIISAHGSDEMKQAWLPGLADGSRIMAFGLTEPDAGSNSHNVTTTIRATGDGFSVSGGKYYISAADHADAILVIGRDGDLAPGRNGRSPLTMLVLPLPNPGVELQLLETALHASDQQYTVFFDDAVVGSDALLGERGHGLKQAFAGLNPERILAAALSNGMGRYAVSRAVEYAKDRAVWSVPIGAHQGVAHPLAQAHIEVELARLATARAAELFDAGEPAAGAANIAKFAAADASLKALDQSIQTHGGNGLALEYGLTDLWFVARLMKTAPVSREMVLNFVAQSVLGLPESY